MTGGGASPARRYEVLDAWRGVAALGVALVHLTTESVLHRNAVIGNAVSFALARLAYTYVERPGQRIFNRWADALAR